MEYQKTTDFFIKTKGLHSYFERNGGKLDTAVVNANRSVEDKLMNCREYTYSEFGRLIIKLKETLSIKYNYQSINYEKIEINNHLFVFLSGS